MSFIGLKKKDPAGQKTTENPTKHTNRYSRRTRENVCKRERERERERENLALVLSLIVSLFHA